MYATTPAQLVEMQQGQLNALNAIGQALFGATEKLVELNLAAARAVMADSAASTQTLLGAKDAQELAAIASGLAQPTLEKLVSYSRNAYGITSGASAEITKIVEAQFADSNRKVSELVEFAGKSLPGSEPALAMFKSAAAAANTALDTVNKAAKQATDWAESNFTAAASATINAASAANDAVKAKAKKVS